MNWMLLLAEWLGFACAHCAPFQCTYNTSHSLCCWSYCCCCCCCCLLLGFFLLLTLVFILFQITFFLLSLQWKIYSIWNNLYGLLTAHTRVQTISDYMSISRYPYKIAIKRISTFAHEKNLCMTLYFAYVIALIAGCRRLFSLLRLKWHSSLFAISLSLLCKSNVCI